MSFVVWVWAVGIFSAAGGQSTSYGELFGVVRDSQGLLVPGASVSVSGANVLGAQETFTDRHGSYHFRALFPGELSLTVEMDGFETVERGGIIVRTGATVVVDITLQPAGIAEQVTVTAAQLDRRTTRVGVSYEGEVVNAVPSSTDLWGVLAQSPGIRMRGYDVGGSHKATQTRYETFGIRGQNRIVSDGVDSTEGNESAGIYYDFYSVEEFQVSTAGADVEMTSPGASVVMTAKSGGDALSGLLHLDYEGSGMVGDNNSPELEERGFTGNHNLLFWKPTPIWAGPSWRDERGSTQLTTTSGSTERSPAWSPTLPVTTRASITSPVSSHGLSRRETASSVTASGAARRDAISACLRGYRPSPPEIRTGGAGSTSSNGSARGRSEPSGR